MLETNLIPRQFPPNSSRNERSKSREQHRIMGDSEEKVPESQDSSTAENKVNTTHTQDMEVAILANQKRYWRGKRLQM